MRIGPAQNQLYEDLALEHEKMIWGIVFHALREITGKDPDDPEMQQQIDKNLGLLFPDHKRFFEVIWKGDVIVRVHTLETQTIGKDTIVRHRRIDEPWKRRWRVIH